MTPYTMGATRTALFQKRRVVRARTRDILRRMIATGERPGYRLTTSQDGRHAVLEVPRVVAPGRDGARAAIAAWLDCEPDAFDLET